MNNTNSDRWKNRRRMAWVSLMAALGFPLLILWSDSAQIGAIAVPFYLFVTGVVSSYIGFATWDDVSHDKNSSSTKSV